jgi:hypothetical protein
VKEVGKLLRGIGGSFSPFMCIFQFLSERKLHGGKNRSNFKLQFCGLMKKLIEIHGNQVEPKPKLKSILNSISHLQTPQTFPSVPPEANDAFSLSFRMVI